MRLYCSAYLAYSIQIHDTDGGTLDHALKDFDGVSYLHAGRFDQQHTYLTTECHGVDAGGHFTVAPAILADRPEQAAWDDALTAAAEALGFTDSVTPGWLLIPDVDN
ncbi:hypothetical protein [Streptomyces sp. NPDC096033]|uniref:hypothetical protein n=1 Tax=Streptomyces sp. NPDC096033 TaxID=3366071 RepID=UPI0038161BE6